MASPIIYKTIPTQYAFFVEKDGKVRVTIVTKLQDMKFKDEKELGDTLSYSPEEE